MANKTIFQSLPGRLLPSAQFINEAGGAAYALSPEQQLAQYAATGCLNGTYYASAEIQLSTLLALCGQVTPRFIAQTAIYCRKQGHMKDSPALLAAILTMNGQEYLPSVFESVIDNGKMLRNFVQILRSGAVGRKSLGTRPKKLVQQWLNNASEKALLSAAVGKDPSLADIVKMVHPKPTEAWREAFFAWLIGKPYDVAALPPLTTAFETYKRDRSAPIPDVPFQMLTALGLDRDAWAAIARNGGWQMVRMNLNTFLRQDVFAVEGMTAMIASKLRDANAIEKARVFPYQLLTAYKSAKAEVPLAVREALQDAMELALRNVPALPTNVVVCPDVSGSMSSAVTGARGAGTTAVRCIDVAALYAAAVLRKNPNAMVLPFEREVVPVQLNPRDSVITNAEKLAAIGGGGTDCSAPLAKMNKRCVKADLVIFISDNESWMNNRKAGATATMREWEQFKARNPNAKLVCVDIQPYATTQAAEREDILNVGGFSDDVFRIIEAFATGTMGGKHWLEAIEAISL